MEGGITGSGTPLPPTGLPALHQPITVTPRDQPGVTYKVSLDQLGPTLSGRAVPGLAMTRATPLYHDHDEQHPSDERDTGG